MLCIEISFKRQKVENLLIHFKIHHDVEPGRPWKGAGGVDELEGFVVHLLSPPWHDAIEERRPECIYEYELEIKRTQMVPPI